MTVAIICANGEAISQLVEQERGRRGSSFRAFLFVLINMRRSPRYLLVTEYQDPKPKTQT
jgi:hypothetical protein